jgi:hypothetical protein
MKRIRKVITHPLLIILFFCGILISGEQMGGIYLLYLLLGLPHLVSHSVLGITGILCLLFSYYSKKLMGIVTNIVGGICMIASLVYFFIQPNGSYNNGTFYQFLPLLSLIIFGVLVLIFVISNVISVFNNLNNKNGHLTV